jgi:hypothetical protein
MELLVVGCLAVASVCLLFSVRWLLRCRVNGSAQGAKDFSPVLDAEALMVALRVPESNPLLCATLQLMDAQREELVQDAGEIGIEPAEAMARARAAEAIRTSSDELVELVRDANRRLGDGANDGAKNLSPVLDVG